MADWKNLLKTKGSTLDIIHTEEITDAAFIKKLRDKLGMSQNLLSAVLGISKKTVEKWEQNANPCAGAASRLLYLLDKYPELADEFYEFKNLDDKPMESVDINSTNESFKKQAEHIRFAQSSSICSSAFDDPMD